MPITRRRGAASTRRRVPSALGTGACPHRRRRRAKRASFRSGPPTTQPTSGDLWVAAARRTLAATHGRSPSRRPSLRQAPRAYRGLEMRRSWAEPRAMSPRAWLPGPSAARRAGRQRQSGLLAADGKGCARPSPAGQVNAAGRGERSARGQTRKSVAAGHTRPVVVDRSLHSAHLDTQGIKGALGFLDLSHSTSADNPSQRTPFRKPQPPHARVDHRRQRLGGQLEDP